ncbi:MAG: DUF547 domain-containing protein [Spirochaetaceae bacterium]|nr:MAG: DUF547 domain-containing protein [Spirochaetaceae bacterium]
MKRIGGRLSVAILILVLSTAALHAAPQAELWPRWEAHDPDSAVEIDHSQWETLLDRYLLTDHPSGVNRVRYRRVSAQDRALLQSYIAALEAVHVSGLNRDEQMAYWLNLYNAVTVELILEHYPVDSIRDIGISGSVLNRHPWDAELVVVEGEAMSLNDIEHRVIRPIWQDERIHYAVNCASIGCPNLQPVAFTAANYRELFDTAAREYINHPRGARFEDNRLYMSSIFDWYQVDFGGDIDGVVAHMLQYAEDQLAADLRRYSNNRYRPRPRHDYDWVLNEP